jgi:DNA-directed RNA polymerase specialized sigma24 family protein/transcriptional regulator with XRE-family HTH domain
MAVTSSVFVIVAWGLFVVGAQSRLIYLSWQPAQRRATCYRAKCSPDDTTIYSICKMYSRFQHQCILQGGSMTNSRNYALRNARRQRNLTMSQLADAAMIGASTLWRAEHGYAISAASRQLLCAYFGMTSHQLGFAEQEPDLSEDGPVPDQPAPISEARVADQPLDHLPLDPIVSSAEQGRRLLRAFEARLPALRRQLSTGQGWFEVFSVPKRRFKEEMIAYARALDLSQKKQVPVPAEVEQAVHPEVRKLIQARADVSTFPPARREEELSAAVPESIESREDGIDPEQEALLADSVGLALLVVLDTLSPAERLAFALHDIFAMPFEEIARGVERSEAAIRQLASRARRRVRGGAMVKDADLAASRTVVDALLAAARGGDFNALLTVLDPEIVFSIDGATSPKGLSRQVHGAQAVARQFSGRAQGFRTALVDGDVVLIVALIVA